ncbi:hypothetical protein [Reinekea sp. G2M2-21]|uniref:ribosome modulation factor n=1 Tax=Reinekea sp. G2M2-21 TaxID=2788942 RepID=UPI0018AB6BAD|nr:hypothetical protein [Reinekea sp. G2M2-21]
MTDEQQAVYDEGYRAYFSGRDESNNPYETGFEGALGEFWSDGFEDAEEDESQR